MSTPGRRASGPVCPKTDTRTYTRDGGRSLGPRHQRSIVPGRKFSHRTSTRSASRRQEGLPFPKPKVESNALAPSALDRPHERVPVVERTQAAEELTYAWLFHLNDVCPELTQRAGAEGRGDTRADIEHPEPVKGASLGLSRRPPTGYESMIAMITCSDG